MPARSHDLTVKEAAELADELIPRIEKALEPKFAAMHARMDDHVEQLASLKAKSRMWGAIGGLFSSAPTWLPGLLTKIAGH